MRAQVLANGCKVVNKPIGGKNVYFSARSLIKGEVLGSLPTGYTVVGSPNIVDGVASGFSSSDYLQLQKNLPVLTTTNNWEMGSKIITPASGDGIILGITTWYLNGFRYANNGKKVVAQFYDYANGAYVEVSSGTLSPNTAYYIKTYCSGTNLVLAVSTDKQTWTEYTTALSSNFTTNPTDYHVHLIGGGGNYGTFDGSIDLNETYIFCDGVCFFRGDMPNGRFI